MEKALFKAKRIDTSEWVYGYFVKDPHNNCRIYLKPFEEATSNTYYFVVPESIFQYIGEINGVKVWEGDIHLTETECDGQTVKGYLPIVYDNGAYWLDVSRKKDGSHLELLAELDEPLNIVGNIHNNPELLKIT